MNLLFIKYNHYLTLYFGLFNPLNANPTKWSNRLKQYIIQQPHTFYPKYYPEVYEILSKPVKWTKKDKGTLKKSSLNNLKIFLKKVFMNNLYILSSRRLIKHLTKQRAGRWLSARRSYIINN